MFERMKSKSKFNTLINILHKSWFFYPSSIAALFLIIKPNTTAIYGIAVWLIILFWLLKHRHKTSTCSNHLVSGILILLFSPSFYKTWINSSKAKLISSWIGLDHRVFLIGVIVALGIASIGMISTFIATCNSLLYTNTEIHYTDSKNRLSLKEIIVILSTAIISITLFSKSSPCYPINDWVDTNIFLTVGKSILHGKVLYLDIYEQKGPLLFFIFTIPAFISETSFIGVYFLEIISAFIFLYFSYKIARVFTGKTILHYLPVYAFIIYSTKSFAHGGSVEEFCIPMLTCSLYYLIVALNNQSVILNSKQSFIIGIFIGCIFWIKYTMIGMYFGYVSVLIFLYIKSRQIKTLFRTIGLMSGGVILVSLPILLYFVLNNALGELWTVYFYNNLFLYNVNGNVRFIHSECFGMLAAFHNNKLMFVILICGMIMLFKKGKKECISICICFISALVFIYIRAAYIYYSFLLCSFMPFGYILLGQIINAISKEIAALYRKEKPAFVVEAVFSLILCLILFLKSTNHYLFLESKDNLPQYKMAAIINSCDDKTILNYNVLDVGLYTTTGTIPNTRYFCSFNVNATGMHEEQYNYIQGGYTNFIVTRDQMLDSENYYLVDTESYYFEGADRIYYLYQRNNN